jgi:hypothetical protein
MAGKILDKMILFFSGIAYDAQTWHRDGPYRANQY